MIRPDDLASPWIRLAASILDTIIVFIVLIPIILVVIDVDPNGDSTLQQDLVGAVLFLVVYTSINGYFIYKRGQTLGKLITKIRVVDL